MKTITNALLLLFALLFLAKSLAAQPPLPHSALPPAQPLPGEITLQQAITNALHFLDLAHLPPPKGKLDRYGIQSFLPGLRAWDLNWGD